MSDQEKKWQRDLRQAQNATKQNINPPPTTPETIAEEEEEEGALPMQPELLSKDLDDDIIKENPKSPQAEAAKMRKNVTEKIRSKTARWLFNSWLQIISTAGLAFWAWVYVGFHYVLSYFGGPLANWFPRPGREVIKPFLDKYPAPEKFKKWTEETLGQIIEFFELMFACCCCTACLIPLLGVFLLIYALMTPCESLKELVPTLHSVLSFFGICSD